MKSNVREIYISECDNIYKTQTIGSSLTLGKLPWNNKYEYLVDHRIICGHLRDLKQKSRGRQRQHLGPVHTDTFSKVCVFISLKTEWKHCVHMIVFKLLYPSTRKRYKLSCVGHLWYFQMKVHWDWGHMTNRFQKYAFSIIRPVHTKPIVLCFQISPLWRAISKVCVFINFDPSTRHRYCCVFKSFHSGERFRKFAFSSKVCVFVWTGHENATKCLRFQMKTHPCGPG